MAVARAELALLASVIALSLAGCTENDAADGGCEDGASGPGGVVGFDIASRAVSWVNELPTEAPGQPGSWIR